MFFLWFVFVVVFCFFVGFSLGFCCFFLLFLHFFSFFSPFPLFSYFPLPFHLHFFFQWYFQNISVYERNEEEFYQMSLDVEKKEAAEAEVLARLAESGLI